MSAVCVYTITNDSYYVPNLFAHGISIKCIAYQRTNNRFSYGVAHAPITDISAKCIANGDSIHVSDGSANGGPDIPDCVTNPCAKHCANIAHCFSNKHTNACAYGTNCISNSSADGIPNVCE